MSEASDGSPDTPDPASAAAVEQTASWMPAQLHVDEPPRISPGRTLTATLSLLLVVAVLAWALPWATGATWTGILGTLTSVPAWTLPVVSALGLGAVALEALTVRTAVVGSRYGAALQGHAASNALALAIPGGSMLGLGALGWILRRAKLALPVIITGIIAASLAEMVITSALIPLLGLGSYALSSLLAPVGVDLPGAIWAALAAAAGGLIALALTSIMLRRTMLAGVLDQLAEFVPAHIARAILFQRDALVTLLRRRPLALLLPTMAARVLQWAALLVAIFAVGAEVPLLLTVAIFALGRVLSMVPLTPGGAGITETVGAAALVALGVGAEDAAAAMLLLAVATLVVPLLAGGVGAAAALTSAPARRTRA